MKTALFSVTVHKGLEKFALTLIDAGWRIIATKEAAEYLRKKNIDVIDVADFVGVKEDYGFPPTLHPKMEAALTTDFREGIDIVYDVPYGMDIGNDVGGRTLLALAAKGDRIPVMTIEDMKKVVGEIQKNGEVAKEFSKHLKDKVNYEVSKHYLWLASINGYFLGLIGSKCRMLKEGENMYQVPAVLFKTDNEFLGICNFKQVAGDVPCFTNTADLDCILETICKLQSALNLNRVKKPYITIAAKHGNACGIGVSTKDPSEAIEKALWGNAKGIWGGEVITNFPIDRSLAQMLRRSEKREKVFGRAAWMLDVIAAPDIKDSAVKILSSNPNRKLFVNPSLTSPYSTKEKIFIRDLRGGFISQPPADYVIDLKKVDWTNALNNIDTISLIISWAAAFTSNHGGNEVALAKNGALIGVGGGPSTSDAANTAIARSKEQNHGVKGSVFGADAFFPFIDVPEILFRAGCIGGTVPGGGKRGKDVVNYFKKRKMSIGMIPEQYRGFCRH